MRLVLIPAGQQHFHHYDQYEFVLCLTMDLLTSIPTKSPPSTIKYSHELTRDHAIITANTVEVLTCLFIVTKFTNLIAGGIIYTSGTTNTWSLQQVASQEGDLPGLGELFVIDTRRYVSNLGKTCPLWEIDRPQSRFYFKKKINKGRLELYQSFETVVTTGLHSDAGVADTSRLDGLGSH